ncbi:hypothetical protein DRP05_06135 [Archaeoglobales archaeon]|nr:MAG: hypothetical protein DRP05_06135 [Archaeoglobales archaeon]
MWDCRENVGRSVSIHIFDSLIEHDDIPERNTEKQIIESRREKHEIQISTHSIKLPVALEQILEVVELVDRGIEFKDAAKIVAKRRNVTVNTVRDKCCRQLGLNVHQFNALLKNKRELASILTRKFPDYEVIISKKLQI